MAKKPIFEFKVYTDGPVDSGPGEKAYAEKVWELDESSDELRSKGPQLGTVRVKEKEKPSNSQRKDFVAKFAFDDGTKITVTGDLPGGLNWIGSGPAQADDDVSGATKAITVEGRNPKRWG